MKLTFSDFWQKGIDYINSRLSAPEGRFIVDNWRPEKGITDERFPVVEASLENVKCLTIYASKEIKLPRTDMEILYDMWDDYLSGAATRMDLIEKIPRPTYCVAVMKVLKDNIS